MTSHDIMDQLEKWGYRSVKISDEGTGRISIITEETLSKHQQEQIEASMPAGTSVFFTVSSKIKANCPRQLEKWFRDTKRYMK